MALENTSQAPEAVPSAPELVGPSKVSPAIEALLARLRAELAATEDKTRKARLYGQIGALLERSGDEIGAARDLLAAYNLDPTFREPLEGLVRLLERRRSLKNLGRLVEALVRAAATPDEKARAMTMHAAFREDVEGNPTAARDILRDATALEASPEEAAVAWLALEVLAAKIADPTTRLEALEHRARADGHPTWRGLLLLDAALLTAAAGDDERALALLGEARALGGGATYLAAAAAERIARAAAGSGGDEKGERAASALESFAELLAIAIDDPAAGDTLGVPHRVRTRAHLVELWLRTAEARRRAGDLTRAAAVLDAALARFAGDEEARRTLGLAALQNARIRVAELVGDTELAANLASQRFDHEEDGGMAAALAMRAAEQAASLGDGAGALAALSKAVARDPACLPARALQLDLLADGPEPAAFAAEVEAFAEELPTDEGRARAFLLAAYVWGAQAGDAEAAKAALSQAGMAGAPPTVVSRLSRTLASLRGDTAWYEEATRRLFTVLSSEEATKDATDDVERASLAFELLRARLERGDGEGAKKALADLGALPSGTWMATALEALLPDEAVADRSALVRLAALEADPDRARGLTLVAARAAHLAGDLDAARVRLRDLVTRDAGDAVAGVYLAALELRAGDAAASADVLASTAAHIDDTELAATLYMEAALRRFRAGAKSSALEAVSAAAEADEAALALRAWAARGVDTESAEGRRRALAFAEAVGEDAALVALDRLGVELAPGGNPDKVSAALEKLEASEDTDIGLAGAIARLASGQDDDGRAGAALERIAAAGPLGRQLAAAERVLRAQKIGPSDVALAARTWFEVGGGVTAGLEWLGATIASKDPDGEVAARHCLSALLFGEPSEQLQASATVLAHVKSRLVDGGLAEPPPPILGRSKVVRLANLEIAPPGSDPAERGAALGALEDALGEGTARDALALSGWSLLASGSTREALEVFEESAEEAPDDLAAWEGLRTAAEALGDHERRARAAAELGKRCGEPTRAGKFWEEAATLWLEMGREKDAEVAFESAFERDAQRGAAFDKVFRRVRERKEGDRLLAIIGRRLEVTDEPSEIAKLFWEQARVFREKGDVDAALKALENVTMIEPDHVGALALSGEIFIRRGEFEEAATKLSTLASLAEAPAKSRLTAGIAAVDLYENKLDRYDRALDVLLDLHRAGLSTLPVRERLARAAARTGSWSEATRILEHLMEERPEPAGRIEAARLSIAIWRDRLNEVDGAARAVVKLLEEAPGDGEGIDLLLDLGGVETSAKLHLFARARDALLAGLRTNVPDAATARRLMRIARSLGDLGLEQIATGTAIALAGGDSTTDPLMQQIAAAKPRAPQMALTATSIQSLLAPGDEGPPAQLFALLGATLAEALGPNLAALGVGKRDRVDPRSGLALRNEIAAWAGAVGVAEFDLFVGGRDPHGIQGVPGEPPALVIGTGITAPLDPATRGRIARELFAVSRGTTILRQRDETTLAAIGVAACHIADVPIQAPQYAILAEVEKSIGKAIPRRVKKSLAEVCNALVSGGHDVKAWSRRAQMSLARVVLVASGDVDFTLRDTLGESPDRLRQLVKSDDRAKEILRFAFSPSYLDLRRALGLEGAT